MNPKMAENRVRGPTFKLLAAMNIPVYQAKDVKVNINLAKNRLCYLNPHEFNRETSK